MSNKHTPGEWWWADGCLYSENCKVVLQPFEATEADRRLIAAAPDLLAACERYIEDWGTGNDSAAMTQMREAAKKAKEGES
jgi:hypothetical protein